MQSTVFFAFLIQAVCFSFSVDEKCNVNIRESEHNQLLGCLSKENLLGSGGYGKIYKFPVEEQPHCKIVVKVIDEIVGVTFLKEVKALRKLNSFSYSPKFYGCYKNTSSHSKYGFIFMEYIEGEDLFELLKRVF